MNGMLSKFFSLDSIWSRLVRGLLLAVLGGITPGGDIGGVHIPSWIIALLGLVAGMVPAGQNNSSASDASKTDTKLVPPTA